MRDAINDANAGVTASIINDGSGNRLVIASKDSGLANALKITVADDDLANADNAGLSQLVYDASSGGTTNLSQTVAAQNATAVIDGISISKASNTISDAIEGVTLTLLKANTPSATTLSVSRDTAGIQASVQTFVKAYNDLNKTITDLSKYDAATKQASMLTGEATVRSVQSQLRSVFNTSLITAGGGLSTLSDIGICLPGRRHAETRHCQTESRRSATPPRMFPRCSPQWASRRIAWFRSSARARTRRMAATAVHVTRLATQGAAAGGVSAGLTIATGSNDTLDLTVDGSRHQRDSGCRHLHGGRAGRRDPVQDQRRHCAILGRHRRRCDAVQRGADCDLQPLRRSSSAVLLTGGNATDDLFGTQTETAGVDVAAPSVASPPRARARR